MIAEEQDEDDATQESYNKLLMPGKLGLPSPLIYILYRTSCITGGQ